jgi:hypothetical protein
MIVLSLSSLSITTSAISSVTTVRPSQGAGLRANLAFLAPHCPAKIAFGIMPWMPLVPSATWVKRSKIDARPCPFLADRGETSRPRRGSHLILEAPLSASADIALTR